MSDLALSSVNAIPFQQLWQMINLIYLDGFGYRIGVVAEGQTHGIDIDNQSGDVLWDMVTVDDGFEDAYVEAAATSATVVCRPNMYAQLLPQAVQEKIAEIRKVSFVQRPSPTKRGTRSFNNRLSLSRRR